MTSCSGPSVTRPGDDKDQDPAQTSGLETKPEIRRRRHSHFIPRRRKSIVHSIMEGEEAVLLKVGSKDQNIRFGPLRHSRLTVFSPSGRPVSY